MTIISNMTENVKSAYNFASEKHGNQMYGKHPYIYHLLKVYEMSMKMDLSENYQIVALLHDTLEDTETTYRELCDNFGMNTANCVLELTHDKYENYLDYLKGLSISARKVKICDIMCNLEESILTGNQRLIDKYQKALFFLTTN